MSNEREPEKVSRPLPTVILREIVRKLDSFPKVEPLLIDGAPHYWLRRLNWLNATN